MAGELNGLRVAILAADGVERVELERPREVLEDAGARVELLSISTGTIEARDNDLQDAGVFAVDRSVRSTSPDDYDALLLPGGTVNPNKLRMQPVAVEFVRSFVESGKPIAAMCQGPWTLLEAGVIVRPIGSYGMPNHLRVSIGLESENARFLESLAQAVR